MPMHCVLADDQPLGDLTVAHAGGDERDDFSLPQAAGTTTSQQASPRQDSRPSCTATAAITSAATGSDHGQPAGPSHLSRSGTG